MKKLLIILMGLVIFAIGSFVACTSKHEHSYTEKEIPATCTMEGYILFECECGDSYEGEVKSPKAEHVGSSSCDICGLNYYDELKDIIIKNGRTGNNEGFIVYDGKITSDGQATMSTYVMYDKGDEEIQIISMYDLSSIGGFTFIIVIPHPSNGDAIKNSKYSWLCSSTTNCTAIGVLNAPTFSSYTDSLVEMVNDGFNEASINAVRSSFAFLADYGIKDAFIPLLNLGTKGLSIKNFGFANY